MYDYDRIIHCYYKIDNYLTLDNAEELIKFLKANNSNFNEKDLFLDKDKLIEDSQKGINFVLSFHEAHLAERIFKFLKEHYKDYKNNDSFSYKNIERNAQQTIYTQILDHNINDAVNFIHF